MSSIEWEAVKMSEEEEDLISRMYKLVGDRLFGRFFMYMFIASYSIILFGPETLLGPAWMLIQIVQQNTFLLLFYNGIQNVSPIFYFFLFPQIWFGWVRFL